MPFVLKRRLSPLNDERRSVVKSNRLTIAFFMTVSERLILNPSGSASRANAQTPDEDGTRLRKNAKIPNPASAVARL